jgi:hypothetical protein
MFWVLNVHEVTIPGGLKGMKFGLTSKGKRTLKVFENMILTRTFDPLREVVTRIWIKLRDKKLHKIVLQMSTERR